MMRIKLFPRQERKKGSGSNVEKIGSGLRHYPEADDLGRVRELLNKTAFFSDEEVAVALELIEEKLSRGKESSYQFIFACTRDALLGYACYGHIPLTKESYDLYWIAVDPDFQGHGIGKALLEKTEESIIKSGGVHLYVETASRKQYAPTKRFYLSCGYRKAAFFPDFYSHGDGKTVFYKKLA